ncbi:unnamed protein product, partial [Arabidopsis halleri]
QEDVPLPQAEVEVAMGELREVMIQYANCPDPTESAARRERVRLAEEQGEFIQTAEQMVRASLPGQGVTTGLLTPSPEIPSHERIPVAQRLGPLNPEGGVGRGKKRATGKKKLGRPPGKKPSPKSRLGVSLKKRKLLSTQPSPYRRLNMENQEVGEASRVTADRLSGSETTTPAAEEAQGETQAVTRVIPQRTTSRQMDFRVPSSRPPRLKENEEVKRLVADTWSEDERINIHRRLINVRRALILWNKEKQRNSQKEIEKKKMELEKAMVNPVHDGLLLKRINEELNVAYKEEEAFWKQRSRQHWLQLGDRNTGYFHAATKGRRSMNSMTVMETEDGLAVYEEDQIATVITQYYQKLFTSAPVEDEELLVTVSEAIRPCISAELNNRLEAIPSAQEIREGLFDINPEKAPGPDGFSASFFHSNWAAIGDEVVHEGKYYHSSDLLNIKCPASASHGWRSILVGRDLLKKRLGWAIGNGRAAKAWSEPWLSVSKVAQPMGPMPFEGKDLLVGEFFEHDSVEWDQEKVLATFPNYAKEILAIKPSRFGAPDRRIWLASSDGNYTTKSGYAIAREEKSVLEEQQENEGCNWLEEVWRTKVSPKAKLFLWKALVGAIPTGMQLVSRGMHLDSSCLRCKEPESICHLLFNCSFVQQVWKLAPLVGLEEMPLFSEVHKGLSWLREKKQLPPSGLGKGPLYPWICWNLWLSRNQKIFNNRIFSAEETLLKAILDAKEWQTAQESVLPSSLIGRGQNQDTRGDMPRYVLVNTDAAWNQGACAAGLGYVFASEDPTIPQRHAAICDYVSSPLMAECLAIRSALFTALDFGIQFLSLQTDCQVLAKAISTKNLLMEVHGVLSDIFICIAQFKGFICSFVSRAANVEADSLAKATLASYVVNL